MMTKWIYDATDEPAVLFPHRPYLLCTCRDRLGKNRFRLVHDQDEACCATAHGFGTEVEVRGRLATQNFAPCTDNSATTLPPSSILNNSRAPKAAL